MLFFLLLFFLICCVYSRNSVYFNLKVNGQKDNERDQLSRIKIQIIIRTPSSLLANKV